MMNLGFKNLHLVAPLNYQREKAEITARWASSLLDEARIHQTLEAALQDFVDVVGFGGRYDGERFENLALPEWMKEFVGAPLGKTALVFGPEDRGLNKQEIDHCRWLVRIPSTGEYSSYNLAQAVLLALYEISRPSWEGNLELQEQREAPEWNDFYQLERIMDNVLTGSGFYREGTPAPIPGVIKNLLHRMRPDKREIGILLALFARIEKSLRLAGATPDDFKE